MGLCFKLAPSHDTEQPLKSKMYLWIGGKG